MSERLAFDSGIFERQKPVLVDAFGPNLAACKPPLAAAFMIIGFQSPSVCEAPPDSSEDAQRQKQQAPEKGRSAPIATV